MSRAIQQTRELIMNAPVFDPIRDAPKATESLMFRTLSEVEAMPIRWLWIDRIAMGKVSMIAGHPGLGKSQITAFLAAKVSTGGYWPNGEGNAAQGEVVFLSAEDDPADTIKPRLMAAGADVSRCHVLESVRKGGNERGIDLSVDAQRIADFLEDRPGVRLLIIDPISAYMGKVDSNNNSDVRGFLNPLVKLAEKHSIAVILISHLNKSNTQDPITRVIGSMGMVGAVRSCYLVQKDESNDRLRHFVPLKNNIGDDKTGFSFSIVGCELGNDIRSSYISWEDGTVQAKSILSPQLEAKKSATNGARDFLREFLQDGPKLASEVIEAAQGNGHSKSTITRAKSSVATAFKQKGEKNGQWFWKLSSIRPNILGHLETLDHLQT